METTICQSLLGLFGLLLLIVGIFTIPTKKAGFGLLLVIIGFVIMAYNPIFPRQGSAIDDFRENITRIK